MDDDAPRFDEQGRLIAPRYDDLYFSAEDGLAETRHVFLDGNRLAERFVAMPPGEVFIIGETGFGTGLNFLAAWDLFDRYAPSDGRLEFVSVEGFPLAADTIQRALSPWHELDRYRDALCSQWGPIWPGMHRLRFANGRVRLTLQIGDVDAALSSIDTPVHAWFLDGFAPSRNPAMWSKSVFRELARLSTHATTLATYTAAGFVRRGLQAVGFDIEKQPGFGTKRDMSVGRFTEALANRANATTAGLTARQGALASSQPDYVLVIGGSLAGAFVARSLAERGVSVTVLERQALIDGEWPLLRPRVAVLQPKISDAEDAAGFWLRAGYGDVLRVLQSDQGLATRSLWHMCGTFQAAHDERSEKRLRRFVDQFEPTGLCRWIDAGQTEAEVGVPMQVGGLLIERAGVLRPAGLCAALLTHPSITLRGNTDVLSLQRSATAWHVTTQQGDHEQAECVVLANAGHARHFKQSARLQLKPVRGQVTLIDTKRHADALAKLKRAIFYGGYVTPAVDGIHSLGASFIPGDTDTAWRNSEHLGCCDKLERVLPDGAGMLRAIEEPAGWVGLRTTTPRHRCYAEQIKEGLYVSLGHGSHGIASAAAAGEHLASLITGGVPVRVTR